MRDEAAGVRLHQLEGFFHVGRPGRRRPPPGEPDVGIASAGVLPPGLRFEPIGTLRLRLLVPRGHALARRPPRAPADLRGHGYVFYAAGSEGRAFTDAALGRAGLRLP